MGATGLARGRSQAIRPWPDEEACEGKDGAANEILAIYFWKNVELMSQKCQKSLSRRDGDIITSRLLPKMRLKWLAPPALRLALRYICMQSRSLCEEHSLPTCWHTCLRVELRGPAAKFSWVILCLGRLLGCLEIQDGHK